MIHKAIELAQANPAKYKLAAIVLNKKGRVISKGMNLYDSTHPLQAHFASKAGKPESIYLHAELNAIIRSRKQGHTIIVVRVDKQGNLRMAKPCPICQLAIKSAGIKEVIYSINDNELGRYVV